MSPGRFAVAAKFLASNAGAATPYFFKTFDLFSFLTEQVAIDMWKPTSVVCGVCSLMTYVMSLRNESLGKFSNAVMIVFVLIGLISFMLLIMIGRELQIERDDIVARVSYFFFFCSFSVVLAWYMAKLPFEVFSAGRPGT